jgi:hypothetical protein
MNEPSWVLWIGAMGIDRYCRLCIPSYDPSNSSINTKEYTPMDPLIICRKSEMETENQRMNQKLCTQHVH